MLFPTLLGLTACLLIGMIVSRNRWARVVGVALAIPLALLTYGVIGIAIARVIGVWAALILWLLGRRGGQRGTVTREDVIT